MYCTTFDFAFKSFSLILFALEYAHSYVFDLKIITKYNTYYA